MNGFDILNATANVQIAFALTLIAIFLSIIVISGSSKKKR